MLAKPRLEAPQGPSSIHGEWYVTSGGVAAAELRKGRDE